MPQHPPAVDRDVLTFAWLARVLERACTDLTLPQYRLIALIAGGDERASDVAERLALARPTVSATIDTLVERGLLERTAIDTDRRAVRLGITAEGARLMRATQAAMRTRLDEVLAHAEDRPLIEQALGQLSDAMSSERALRRAKRAQRATDPEVPATT